MCLPLAVDRCADRSPYAPMLLCSYVLMSLCSYASMLLCSYAPMLLCSYARCLTDLEVEARGVGAGISNACLKFKILGLKHSVSQWRTRKMTATLVSVPVRSATDPVVVGQLEYGAQGSQCVVLVVDDGVARGLHIACADRVDAGEGLGGRHLTPV